MYRDLDMNKESNLGGNRQRGMEGKRDGVTDKDSVRNLIVKMG